jgi:hypothetical protein
MSAVSTVCRDSEGAICTHYPDVFVLYTHKTCHSERKYVDPEATWGMLCEAMQLLADNPHDDEARELTIECLENVAQWLKKGGVPPKLGG